MVALGSEDDLSILPGMLVNAHLLLLFGFETGQAVIWQYTCTMSTILRPCQLRPGQVIMDTYINPPAVVDHMAVHNVASMLPLPAAFTHTSRT